MDSHMLQFYIVLIVCLSVMYGNSPIFCLQTACAVSRYYSNVKYKLIHYDTICLNYFYCIIMISSRFSRYHHSSSTICQTFIERFFALLSQCVLSGHNNGRVGHGLSSGLIPSRFTIAPLLPPTFIRASSGSSCFSVPPHFILKV